MLAATPCCPQHWAFIAHQWGNKYSVTIQISPNTEVNNCVFLLWRDPQCHSKSTAKSSVQRLPDSFDIVIVCGFTVMQSEMCLLCVELKLNPSSVTNSVQYFLHPTIQSIWLTMMMICCFRALPVGLWGMIWPRIKMEQENGNFEEEINCSSTKVITQDN